MITKIAVENFLCFKQLTFDLTSTKGEPSHYALVYGENGSGKTNLMLTSRFLRASLDTYTSSWIGENHIGRGLMDVSDGYTMKTLFSEYSRIGCSDPMILEYTFLINGKDATYRMKVAKEGLEEEELIYILNGRRSTLFSISKDSTRFADIFAAEFKKDMPLRRRQSWGLHSMLSIVYHACRSFSPEYIGENVSKELSDVIREIMGIKMYFTNNPILSPNPIDNPKSGQMPIEMEPIMDALAKAMRDFFCGLYSDIVDVRYLKQRKQRVIDYELMFDKRVEGETITIPYYKESTGTQKLVDEFMQIMACVHGDTVLVDEMDSGIHDILMNGIFDHIKESIRGQLIATTHNTMLMHNSDPRSTFILDVDGEGYRAVKSVKSITTTQKCNNNTKRYLEGDLGGVPILGHLDLVDISDRLYDSLRG